MYYLYFYFLSEIYYNINFLTVEFNCHLKYNDMKPIGTVFLRDPIYQSNGNNCKTH